VTELRHTIYGRIQIGFVSQETWRKLQYPIQLFAAYHPHGSLDAVDEKNQVVRVACPHELGIFIREAPEAADILLHQLSAEVGIVLRENE